MRALPVLLSLCACSQVHDGLRETPPGTGPTVVVDWEAKPLPELPFPNDLATTRDPTTRTGLRLNIATEAETDFESEARQKLDTLDGFGVYAPISVQFDAPLDVDNLLSRHPDDFWRGTEAFADDGILVINVTPDSPDFGKPVALDLDHGRYPMDVFQYDRYFPNDPRSESTSLLYETYEEDTNNNGALDPGEDSDNDGLLDHPNVWPPGSDPEQHLLTSYDLQTNTLYARPVVPMRDQTTYAVVLTNNLVDTNGQPVRSPWPWVNHTRQTSALEPLPDALTGIGLSVDDVAFAWTFTTGSVTSDLRDLHRALFNGEGPYAALQAAYPAGIEEALQVTSREGNEAYNLSTSSLMDILFGIGAIDVPNLDIISASFEQYSDRVISGSFTTPYLLVDDDDGGRDDSDEMWKLNPTTGEVVHGPQRVAFNCALPKAREGVAQPYPAMLYGHGYGSNRLEFLYFAYVFNRLGWAACSMDFPGHGVEDNDGALEQVQTLLAGGDLAPVIQNLLDGRARDLDNDGNTNSGGDQWSSDSFHTRDMVRQGVLDWMQMVRSLQACGTGTMAKVNYNEDGTRTTTAETAMSCDWDGDGTPDIGGAAPLAISGGSLGGINAGVAAAVIPEVTSVSAIVPGAGIVDVGVRTSIGGAVEAFVGRFMSPLFVGFPEEGGAIRVAQLVNSVTDMRELTVGVIPSVPVGGKVVVSNLRSGISHEASIPADGRFRVAIAADALDPGERRVAAGIPDAGPEEGVVYELPDNDGLGDPLLIQVVDASGAVIQEFDTWPADTLHEGITMRAGSPLVAASDGNGKLRGSYDARRLAFVMALVLEPGDPAGYARHYFEEPFEDLGGRPQNVLVMPNPGDPWVSVNTGVAMGRAAGLIDYQTIDERYGTTVDRFLIDRCVVRGTEERCPYIGTDGTPVLFDIDDLDEGLDPTGAPSEAPVRATVSTTSGESAFRMAYVWPQGVHGFVLDEEQPFDWTNYELHFIGDYATHLGAKVSDRLCYQDASCEDFPPLVIP